MRLAAVLGLGIVAGLAVASREPRSNVSPASVEEMASSSAAAPELAALPPGGLDGEIRPRLVASRPRATDPVALGGREPDPFAAAPVNSDDFPVPNHPEPPAAAEDVRDLVEPQGPYRVDTLERWVRELVVRDAGTEIAIKDGKLEGPTTPDDVSRVREFLAAQRRRFAPPPAEVEVASTERTSIQVLTHTAYVEEYDVEIAQAAWIADPIHPPEVLHFEEETPEPAKDR